jgi:hypothetical protein
VEIVFKMEGGFAALPGLSRPTTVNTDDLPPDEAARVVQLVADACFFDLPPSPKTYPKAADVRAYSIAIADGARRHKVKLVDPVTDPQLVALIDCLKRYAKARPSKTP